MEENNTNNVTEIDKAAKLYETGEKYWNGTNGIPQDYEKAVEYYIEAADLGNVNAIYSLGFCYATSTGIEYDAEKAEKLLAYAADNGHVKAAAKLGEYLYWGDYLQLDKARGFQYLKYAADNGDAHSMALVGNDYINGFGAYEGWGPTKDLALGKEYIDKACELESPYGLFLAGSKYRRGYDGFPENLEYGTQLLKKASEAGHHYAQLQYALACWNGEGVPKSEQEYIKWMRESAGNGNDEAIIRWAWTRFTGIVQGVRCNSQQELNEVRDLLDAAYSDGNDFLNQDEISAVFQELYDEENKLGRRLSIEEMYGSTPQSTNSNSYGNNSSSGGCYVATAVYGSYDCPQVWTLRRFRDFSLAKKWYGRGFIKFYYAVSPTMVKYFGNMRWFHIFFRKRLDKLVAELNAHGYGNEPYYDR